MLIGLPTRNTLFPRQFEEALLRDLFARHPMPFHRDVVNHELAVDNRDAHTLSQSGGQHRIHNPFSFARDRMVKSGSALAYMT